VTRHDERTDKPSREAKQKSQTEKPNRKAKQKSQTEKPNRKAKQKSHAQLRMAGSVPADITAGGSIVPNGQAITVAGSLRGCRTTAVRGSCFGACLGANCDAQSWKTTWDTTRAQTSVADDFVATPTKGTRSIQSFASRSG
jgi:hypothetical protein